MNNRKPPQQFNNLMSLIDELNSAGHSSDKIWYSGKLINGKQSWTNPVTFIAADSRMIAQRRSDGTWWTLYGYDDMNDPVIPEPTNSFNLDEHWFQLITLCL
ncbi:hypothetical protein JHD93_20525 [Cronobacter sakazakii]|uniref:hypothetical protein n=1 Tax=Cronobacter sakazakii TaxID=28141 RepID=UPI001909E604|nr:hypothetical protein [Cronobacter sakazakii]MBK4114533.1 hypothetical protein [Cronobacter sakazakii]